MIIEGVGFDEAFAAVMHGYRIWRRIWQPDDVSREPDEVFVVFQAGYPDGIGINANTARATGYREGSVHAFTPYLMQRTARGAFTPWLPNHEDLFAEDWCLTEVIAE